MRRAPLTLRRFPHPCFWTSCARGSWALSPMICTPARGEVALRRHAGKTVSPLVCRDFLGRGVREGGSLVTLVLAALAHCICPGSRSPLPTRVSKRMRVAVSSSCQVVGSGARGAASLVRSGRELVPLPERAVTWFPCGDGWSGAVSTRVLMDGRPSSCAIARGLESVCVA